MRIPRALADDWRHEPEWLGSLPRLALECAEQWSLELEDPIDTPHSLVVPAGEAVLKLNAPSHFEADREADALQLWNGDGVVRLLARDDELRALLLERCRPGTELWVPVSMRGPWSPSSYHGCRSRFGTRIPSRCSSTRRTGGRKPFRGGTTTRGDRSSERSST